MKQKIIILLTFLVSITISTISVGPNGGVLITPGSSKIVSTNSPVYISNSLVPLVSQIQSVSGSLGFIAQAYPVAINTLAIQYIATYNATGSALLSIGSTWYLAVTQNGGGPLIFTWNNGTEQFVLWDNFTSGNFSFTTAGYQGATFFSIGSQNYVAFAGSVPFIATQDGTGHFSNLPPNFIYAPGTSNSRPDNFLDAFSITTAGVPSYYLLEATSNGSNLRVWNGANFGTTIQSFPTHINYETEHFVVGGTTYISINDFDATTVDIYFWNSTAFSSFTSLQASNPRASTFFQIAGNYYLAVAEYGGTSSTVWQFSNGAFTRYQSIPTWGAWAWQHFTIAGLDFLGLASKYAASAGGFSVSSKLYGWNGLEFSTYATISTSGATSLRGFNSNGFDYIFGTNSYNNQTSQANSVVYRLTPL